MVDTLRSRSALISLLADNSSGDIDAQDVRDFLKSVSVRVEGSGAPAVTPEEVGDVYVDTTNDVLYCAIGTSSSADWRRVGAGAWTQIGSDVVIETNTTYVEWTIPDGAAELRFYGYDLQHSHESNQAFTLKASTNAGSSYIYNLMYGTASAGGTSVVASAHVVIVGPTCVICNGNSTPGGGYTGNSRTVVGTLHNVLRSQFNSGQITQGTLQMFWR